jgi:hypothetical protein
LAVPLPTDFDGALWTGDERSFHAVRTVTSRYADADWRRENFPAKHQAAAFLRWRYP